MTKGNLAQHEKTLHKEGKYPYRQYDHQDLIKLMSQIPLQTMRLSSQFKKTTCSKLKVIT